MTFPNQGDTAMTDTTETTVTHPAWCHASRCIPSPALDDFEHRSIVRAIGMKHVTGTMSLSDWGANPDVEYGESNLMVHAELESVELAEKLLVMLSPAEARELATALLGFAETAEAETVHGQIARKYSDIAEYIATATSIGELRVLFDGTFTVPTLVGVELRRRIDVRRYALANRP
jgi:hypothetical protein